MSRALGSVTAAQWTNHLLARVRLKVSLVVTNVIDRVTGQSVGEYWTQIAEGAHIVTGFVSISFRIFSVSPLNQPVRWDCRDNPGGVATRTCGRLPELGAGRANPEGDETDTFALRRMIVPPCIHVSGCR